MIRKFFIHDIFHSGEKEIRWKRKTGDKYDNRRGSIIYINLDNYVPGDRLVFGKAEKPYLWTTPYVESYEKNGYFYIETLNSIYELLEINGGENDGEKENI